MAEQPPNSEITTEFAEREHGSVLAVAGEVDLLTAGDFERALADAQRRSQHLLVDIRGVTFMDSTGLRALLEARQRAADGGSPFFLQVEPDGAVARLLDLAGVAELFALRDGDADGPA